MNLVSAWIKKLIMVAIGGFLVIYVAPSNAAEKASSILYGVHVYSNLCLSKMSDDLYGNRITILKMADGTTVIFEYNDGGSNQAIVATNVDQGGKSRDMTFEVKVDNDPSKVVGRFARNHETLSVKGLPFAGEAAYELKRLHKFAPPIPYCMLK